MYNDDYLITLVCRAPLKGTVCAEYGCQMHQLLIGKVLGEHAEERIRDKQNGCVKYHNLRKHFEGEGNVSCHIAPAETVYKTLHYRQERSMKFFGISVPNASFVSDIEAGKRKISGVSKDSYLIG